MSFTWNGNEHEQILNFRMLSEMMHRSYRADKYFNAFRSRRSDASEVIAQTHNAENAAAERTAQLSDNVLDRDNLCVHLRVAVAQVLHDTFYDVAPSLTP
jgi:hypothetical protein